VVRFLFDYEIGGTCGKICACLERKTTFVMQNFSNSGAMGSGYPFLVETPKSRSSADSALWAIGRLGPSSGVAARRVDEKRKGTKGHKLVIFHPFWEILQLTKCNETWVWVGVPGVINYAKFGIGNNRLRGVKSYRGSNFLLFHRNGLSPVIL